MSTWVHDAVIESEPDRILGILTDPNAAGRWSPVEFDCEGSCGPLRTGSEVVLSGKIAGLYVAFEVLVDRADSTTLELTATGPVKMKVLYTIAGSAGRSQLSVRIDVSRGRGITSAVLARATDAILAAGALQSTVARIAREVELA